MSGLFWLVLLSGCTLPFFPAKLLRVSGRVVDRHTGQALGGATVQAYAQRGSGLGAGGYAAVAEPHTADAEGNFSFAFLPDPAASYLLLATAPPGYYTIWGEAPTVRRRQPAANLRLPVQAPAYLRIRLLDEPPRSRVWLTVSGYAGPADEFAAPASQTYVRRIDAREPRYIAWSVRDTTGRRTDGAQQVRVTALDTLSITIRF
ncbi:carboxypeptidase-like regulatory domain-containing protein [Hymenobacter sp. BT635]|uniref:Carboxypeptidase-like regulatory domain-containing protein n=1 Tax=Hymenobacter nitidus TaxID=2880929 RepID=A0ABS8ADN7_9BACT|nr:carboxypeptidase-like regulatory domain-containing protein [Hymenobacter nitidus]